MYNKRAALVAIILCLTLSQAQETPKDGNVQAEPAQHALSEDTNQTARSKSVPYFRASMPMRIYECLREFSMLRCTKLFVLQKLDERKQLTHSGNLTKDFMEQFFGEDTQMGKLNAEKYRQLSEQELNQRLVQSFQRFFKHRDIKLHFLPGMLIKVVPSKENKLKFTFKKVKSRMGRARRRDTSEMPLNLMNLQPLSGGSSASVEVYEQEAEGDSKQQGLGGNSGSDKGGGHGLVGNIIRKRQKNKKPNYKTTMLQMAVPILVMPAILLGSLLPFILPALKMATIMSLLMNNGAFMAALLYAARTQVNAQEEQHISYGYGSGGGTYH